MALHGLRAGHDRHLPALLAQTETGPDVSAIAKGYGGGGHKNAAGFQMPRGWEGDDHNI
jgi:nanoRNase/pAp phosphatase (c-di-AMP/oligoRNAs hydrolase)